MDLYCLACDDVVRFVELADSYGAFACACCNRYEEYSIRWGNGPGYYIVNFHCYPYGASTAYFMKEKIVCMTCRNTSCGNYVYLEVMEHNLRASMERLFVADEAFNPEHWRRTFPSRVKDMYAERKSVIETSLSELQLRPKEIEGIIAEYVCNMDTQEELKKGECFI